MSCLRENEPHEYVDVYEEEETIPNEVVLLADRVNNSQIAGILESGKLKSKVYVRTYCKRCGARPD